MISTSQHANERDAFQMARMIVDKAYDAFVAIDLNGLVSDWNSQAELLFGWERTEVIGRPLAEIIVPQQLRAAHTKGIEHFRSTGEGPVLNKRIEVPALHRSGRELTVELAVFPIEVGSKYSFGAFIHDIGERKAIEQDLNRLNCRLQSSNSELEQFAYVAAHDLREPIRTIISYLALVTNKLGDDLDEDTKENIHFIYDASNRMQSLISDLLSYSRISTKGQELKDVDMNQIFDQTVEELSTASHERKAELTRGALPVVKADVLQIGQLLSNLICNAMKYCHAPMPKVHLSAEPQGDYWLFKLTDNGIGFEEQYREQIFFMFKRLHGMTEYSGTGMGLAICKKIVERHGGTIEATSIPQEGSTFSFTLPARK